MSEATEEKPSGPAVARTPRASWRPFHDWKEARARFKDLLVVFFGVYAAFLLNRFETDRRDNIRRRQLLEALEHEVGGTVEDLKTSLQQSRAAIEDFDRKLAAGEMPPLAISSSSTAYSANDDATLLQAGGLELLDVETLDQLREVNQLQRSLVDALHTNFQLGLTMLSTHENADFYDPATKQLRRHYAWYPVIIHTLLKNGDDLLASEERFLALIRAKRGEPAKPR